jgi:NAD(P)H dehydrogenase (quinone)
MCCTLHAEQETSMSDLSIRVVIAYHSPHGHTHRLATAVRDGARAIPWTAAQLVDVADLVPNQWATLDGADAVVFGCPTYMGGPSAVFKAFAEASLAAWADNLRWRDKVAAGFTHSQTMSGDKLNTLQYFTLLAAQHGMHWVNLDLYPGWCSQDGAIDDCNRLGAWLGVMSQSNREADHGHLNQGDLRTASYLGRRVATVTWQLARGRAATEAPQPVGDVGVADSA